MLNFFETKIIFYCLFILDKVGILLRWKYSLLSKMVCDGNGNVTFCVVNSFKKLDDPESYGLENTINVCIPVKSGKISHLTTYYCLLLNIFVKAEFEIKLS